MSSQDYRRKDVLTHDSLDLLLRIHLETDNGFIFQLCVQNLFTFYMIIIRGADTSDKQERGYKSLLLPPLTAVTIQTSILTGTLLRTK